MIRQDVDRIRFPHLNLWRNPFGELSPDERGALACCELEAEIRWLRTAPVRGVRVLQFIGPCGHGKSSHLHYLNRCFPTSTYLYVPPERTVPPWLRFESLLVDEIDRAPWWPRRQLIKSKKLLAIGTHRDLTSAFSRFGITLRTVKVGIRGNLSRLEQILKARIESSIFDRSRPAPSISRSETEMLVQKFGDDLRAIEAALYEQFQTRPSL